MYSVVNIRVVWQNVNLRKTISSTLSQNASEMVFRGSTGLDTKLTPKLQYNIHTVKGRGGRLQKIDYMIYGWSLTLDDYEILQNNERISG